MRKYVLTHVIDAIVKSKGSIDSKTNTAFEHFFFFYEQHLFKLGICMRLKIVVPFACLCTYDAF